MPQFQQFPLPDAGEGLTEADVVTWRVAVGDRVEVNQPLVEIETAKSLVELPCPVDGVITKLLVNEGDTVEVGSPVHLVSGPACRFEATGTMTIEAMSGSVVPMKGNPTTVRVFERLTPARPNGGITFGWFDPCTSPVILSLKSGATILSGVVREKSCAYPSVRPRLGPTPASANKPGYREVSVG